MSTLSLDSSLVQSNAATQWAIQRVINSHHSLPFILAECYTEPEDAVARCLLMLRLGTIVHDVLPREQDGTISPSAFALLNGLRWTELADEILSYWSRTDVALFIEEDRLEAEAVAARLAADEAAFDAGMEAAFAAYDATGVPDECSKVGMRNAEEAYALHGVDTVPVPVDDFD